MKRLVCRMKRTAFLVVVLAATLAVPTLASASPVWYEIAFTGQDIWTYSPDNAAQSRSDQAAPRRYATYTTGSRVLQATTYGVGGLPGTGFGTWAPTSGFAFDSINLWGAGNTGDWNETYTSVGNSDLGAEGVSSWQVLQSPTGWSSGIVKGNESYSADATHAFPVWRSAGTADMLGLGNMSDPAFAFKVRVLTDTANVDVNGNLRVFFGGFSDDLQMTGPNNYEVSGVMTLKATRVPEPGTLALLGLGLVAIGRRVRNRK